MFFQEVSHNSQGNDYVVGDIHGCFSLLMQKITLLNFDFQKDRLFCTGDLIDRGNESFNVLELLKEDWFYSVKGNHETLLLSYFGVNKRDNYDRYAFIFNGGNWVNFLSYEQYEMLKNELLPIVGELPLVISVKDNRYPFYITHAQRVSLDSYNQFNFMTDDYIKSLSEFSSEYDDLIWGRELINLIKLNVVEDDLPINFMPPLLEKDVTLTYVGHSVLNQPILSHSHCFIDGGAYLLYTDNVSPPVKGALMTFNAN